MAKKLTDDQLNFILNINGNQAQEEIRKFNTANKELENTNKSLRIEMAKMEAQGKASSDSYKNLSTTISANNATIAGNKQMIAELTKTLSLNDLTMSQLRKQAQQLQGQLNNTSKSLSPESYAKLELKLNAVKSRMSELGTSSEKTHTSLLGIVSVGAAIGNAVSNFVMNAVSKMKDFISSGIEMAAKAQGIQRAFDGLNNPHLLDKLREATEGTVDNLKLMQLAVKADHFKIPLDQLGDILKFVKTRADDTGESFDELAARAMQGFGTQMPRSFVKLGISVNELKEKTNELGSVGAAAYALMQESLKKTAGYQDTAKDKQERYEASITNLKLKIGEELLPVEELWLKAETSIMNILIQIPAILKDNWQWIALLAVAYGAYKLAVIQSTIASAVDVTWKKAQELWTNRVAIAQGILNLILSANPIGIIITLVGALVAAFITWYNHSLKVQAVTQGLFAVIKVVGQHLIEFFTGIWKVISGAITFDPKKIAEGVGDLKKSMSKWGDDVATAYKTAYDKRMATATKKQDKPNAPADPANPADPDTEKKALQKKLDAIDAEIAIEETKLKEKYAKGLIGKSEYENKLYLIEQNAAMKRYKIYENDTKKQQEEYVKMLDARIQYVNEMGRLDSANFKKTSLDMKKTTTEAQKGLQGLAKAETKNQVSELQIRMKQIDIAEKRELSNKDLTEREKTDIEKKYNAQRLALTQLTEDQKSKIYSDAFSALSDLLGKNSAAGKAAAIAKATIDTYVAANQALATIPPPFGAIAAATAIAEGLINVKNIVAVNTSASAPSSSSSNSGHRVLTGFSEGGYTGDGYRNDVAGVVHRGEYVVAQPEMRNPAVSAYVRAIETVRTQRTSANQTTIGNGYSNGGYTGSAPSATDPDIKKMIASTNALLEHLKKNGVQTKFSFYAHDLARTIYDNSLKGGSR
jgi:hypothetical protein